MNDPKDLIQGYIDGELTPIQEAELNAWIKQDPANPRSLAAAVMLHDQLANKMRASRDLVSAPVRFPSFPSHSGKRIVRALTLFVSLATAAILLVVVLGGWPNSVNAATELDRLIETPAQAVDRTYRILSLDEGSEPLDDNRPSINGATLHVRHPNSYVLLRLLPDGKPFINGSDGTRSWSVRPTGAVRVSLDPLRFRGPLPGHQHGLPFVDLRSDLVQLRDSYELRVMDSPIRGWRLLQAERKPHASRGPKQVEVWYDVGALVIHRMVFRKLPQARGGPESVAVELIDQRRLGPDFFNHAMHHAPDRRVIQED